VCGDRLSPEKEVFLQIDLPYISRFIDRHGGQPPSRIYIHGYVIFACPRDSDHPSLEVPIFTFLYKEPEVRILTDEFVSEMKQFLEEVQRGLKKNV
jgi:hypothetical protein